MDWRELREQCLAWPGSVEEFPFGDEVSVFKVGGKMFALSHLDGEPLQVSVKCDPELAVQLRAAYAAIGPGYHLNKRHWNTITLDGSVADEMVGDLVGDSYELVVASLPKARRPAGRASRRTSADLQGWWVPVVLVVPVVPASNRFGGCGALPERVGRVPQPLNSGRDRDDPRKSSSMVIAHDGMPSQPQPQPQPQPGSQVRPSQAGPVRSRRTGQHWLSLAEATTGGILMAKVGYTLMTEQAGPKDLVRWAARAEDTGFDLLVSSDHYFPWLDEQGHAPNAWVTLGAVAQATERAELMTYVTCPTMRYHPAVVAQQAATLALLSDNRFTLGLGAGENLNEHVTGAGWPGADQRQDMLAEAVQIIRALLDGGYVNFEGVHFRAAAAKLWDLPDRPVPLGVAVSGRQSCERFAPLADVMIAVEPDGSLAEWWDAASAAGQPARKVGQLPICWGPDRDECIRRAHEQFRWFGGGWKVNAELPGPAGFASATSFVRPEDVADSIPCGDSVDAVAEAASAFFKAGFTDLALVQIGGTESEQEQFFAAAPELITALKETAG